MVLRVAKLRNDSRMLYLSALSALLGCATWRLTYSLVAFNPGGGYHYFPTLGRIVDFYWFCGH